jgi:two-component system, chemotaxis family, protein-glutamate methylesterase/glutaminase
MGFQVIAVGTSVGGLHALIAVLGDLPATFSLPLVVVQHRAPDPRSGLAELLQSHTRLTVVEADDKDPIEPGHVYLAPPDYHLLIEADRTLALSTDGPVHYARPSIDVMFESAADVYRESVIGVVLTGASADGARGAQLIKRCGGWLIVQDPDTAESRVLPDAVLSAVKADDVVPLDRLAATLRQLAAGMHV